MTAVEAAPWIAGLKQMTGLDWQHRVDHKARDEFRTLAYGYELHLWSTGRWALYDVGGNGVLTPGDRPFQQALGELQQAFQKRLNGY